MNGMTIGIIVLVIAAIAFYIYQRSRPAPHGTYNDPKVNSSGSIGGGPKAYDSPEVHSGGSIGGGAKAYDTPEVKSEGSIGGRSSPTARKGQKDNTLEEQSTVVEQSDKTELEDELEEPTYNSRNVKSSGSFGAS